MNKVDTPTHILLDEGTELCPVCGCVVGNTDDNKITNIFCPKCGQRLLHKGDLSEIDIPKKPIEIDVGYDIDTVDETYCCPTCTELFLMSTQPVYDDEERCPYCDQKLDWGAVIFGKDVNDTSNE